MATVPYLTLVEFKAASMMPASYIDALEITQPGWVDNRLLYVSSKIDSRLTKRYDAPFVAPYPLAVKDWLARIVTLECWQRRGVEPTDAEMLLYREQHDKAYDEIREAADSQNGLFDLPKRADVDTSGVTRGFPRGYSEASPYVAFDIQRRIGRAEDESGGGT